MLLLIWLVSGLTVAIQMYKQTLTQGKMKQAKVHRPSTMGLALPFEILWLKYIITVVWVDSMEEDDDGGGKSATLTTTVDLEGVNNTVKGFQDQVNTLENAVNRETSLRVWGAMIWGHGSDNEKLTSTPGASSRKMYAQKSGEMGQGDL